jgi:hypothetical protein
MLRASDVARRVAATARAEFERDGVGIDQLKACQPEGPDGTELPHCMKVYLPPPDGLHGMVFDIDRVEDDSDCCMPRSGYGIPAEACVSRRCTKSRTDDCTSLPRAEASTASGCR